MKREYAADRQEPNPLADHQALRETAIERLADEVERHLNTHRLRSMLELTAVPV